MGIFQFIIILGIINIVFVFVWKWVVALPSAIILTTLRLDKSILLVKAFGAYVLISLTALVTISALQGVESGWKLFIFPIIGVFVLFMGFASNAYERQKQNYGNYNYSSTNFNSWFDLVLMFGSIILFILILFIPAISVNSLNEWFYGIIIWVSELPVIGWLIGIGGVIFMISLIFHGLVIVLSLAGLIYSKIKGRDNNDVEIIKGENIEEMKEKEEEIVAEVEEINYSLSQQKEDNTTDDLLACIDDLDPNEFPQITSLDQEGRKKFIESLIRVRKKNPESKMTNWEVLSFNEDMLKKYGNYYNKENRERAEKTIYQYKINYIRYNVDEKKFPKVKSLPPEDAVKLTDEIGEEYPDMNIEDILIILEEKLNK